MRREPGKNRSFFILLMLLVITGCVFLNMPALGEADSAFDGDNETAVIDFDGESSAIENADDDGTSVAESEAYSIEDGQVADLSSELASIIPSESTIDTTNIQTVAGIENPVTIDLESDEQSYSIEFEGSKAYVSIKGDVAWTSIQNEIVAGIDSVEVVGKVDGSSVTFSDATFYTYFDYAISFDNVCLKASKNYTGSGSGRNGTANGLRAILVANGHDFKTTSSVTTTGYFVIVGGVIDGSVESTNVCLDGGKYLLVVGGSYSLADSELQRVSYVGTSSVYIGENACAQAVVGGCLGGISTGKVTVQYNSIDADECNLYVIGSSADAIEGSDAETSATEGTWQEISYAKSVASSKGDIEIVIGENARAQYVNGATYCTIDGGDDQNISIVNNGKVEAIYGSWGSSDLSKGRWRGLYPGSDYCVTKSGNVSMQVPYSVEANVDIINNGSATYMYSGLNSDMTGQVNMVVNGVADYVYGGGEYRNSVHGKISIEVAENGYAAHVFGGSLVGLGVSPIDEKIDADIDISIDGKAATVIGGSKNGVVTGDILININGEVSGQGDDSILGIGESSMLVPSGVYGGGWASDAWLGLGATSVGTTEIVVSGDAKVYGDVYAGGIGSTSKTGSVLISGYVSGDVYGGGWSQNNSQSTDDAFTASTTGDTAVRVMNDAKVDGTIYGGGRMAVIGGHAEVKIEDNVQVHDVCAAGNPTTSNQYRAFQFSRLPSGGYSFGYVINEFSDESSCTNVMGNASITVSGAPVIDGTIYGVKTLDGSKTYSGYVAGTAAVDFDGCSGTFARIENADDVIVTNSSDVTIDNQSKDFEQFVSVGNITVEKNSKLTLLADAEIDGEFSGDDNMTGTLAIAAGKCLTCETVSGWTGLSILDNGEIVPAADQVYVLSRAGSTADDGRFSWLDQRNQVALEFKQNEADETVDESITTTQWWLVASSDVTITPASIVSYVGGDSVGGNNIPAMRFSLSLPDGVDSSKLVFTLHTNYKAAESDSCDHEEGWKQSWVEVIRTSDAEEAYYLIPALDADLGDEGATGHSTYDLEADTVVRRGSYLKLVDSTADVTGSLHAGVYQILKRTSDSAHWSDWYLTAEDTSTRTVYIVDVNIPTEYSEDGTGVSTLTVRYVSDEDEMYAYSDSETDQTLNEKVMLNDVVGEGEDVDTSAGAVAVVKDGMGFTTNGSKTLGLFGATWANGGYVDESGAVVSLIFDEVLSSDEMDGVLDSGDLEALLRSYDATIDLTKWNIQHKYLDLVNRADGNAQVVPDGKIGIYWPYPDGITVENAGDYTFRIIHYAGLNREYMLGNSADDAALEDLEVVATERGLYFETDSFSPFTLMWQKNEQPEVESPATGVDGNDNGAGTPMTISSTVETAWVSGTPLTGDATLPVGVIASVAVAGIGFLCAAFATKKSIG